MSAIKTVAVVGVSGADSPIFGQLQLSYALGFG